MAKNCYVFVNECGGIGYRSDDLGFSYLLGVGVAGGIKNLGCGAQAIERLRWLVGEVGEIVPDVDRAVGPGLHGPGLECAGGTLIARCDSAISSFIAKVCDGVFGTGGERTGAMLLAQRGPMVYETVPGALIFSGR